MKAVFTALLIAMMIYISLSILSIYTFGSQVRPDVMDNVGEGRHEWESITLRVAFFIVIICHIPFVFFSSKEAFLILIDELDRKSISEALDRKLLSLPSSPVLTESSEDSNSKKHTPSTLI